MLGCCTSPQRLCQSEAAGQPVRISQMFAGNICQSAVGNFTLLSVGPSFVMWRLPIHGVIISRKSTSHRPYCLMVIVVALLLLLGSLQLLLFITMIIITVITTALLILLV